MYSGSKIRSNEDFESRNRIFRLEGENEARMVSAASTFRPNAASGKVNFRERVLKESRRYDRP